MSCCAPGAELAGPAPLGQPGRDEIAMASRAVGDGLTQTDLTVPGAHCGACIVAVERALRVLPEVEAARMNLSTRRVTVRWRGSEPPAMIEALGRIGYAAHLREESGETKDRTLSELIRALAISGFATGNIMLLSVSVWSGAEGATRDLFHFVSALIAMPALVFAGGIYYRSAWGALSHGRMNMDVPIALGITMAYALSLYETINHGPHAYFDATVSLLFFLLIGRTLDHVMRNRARAAVLGLERLTPRGALIVGEDGTREYRPVGEIEPGMRILLAAGERVPVDGEVLDGESDLDCALATGEAAPRHVRPGDTLQAGTTNLAGPLTMCATARASQSFLAEMTRLMEAAEGGRARYRRIADRVSSLYSPVVHLTALVTLIGWMAVDGDWHRAITIAIAVLIITCPCALGLAVPIVQVVAARRLFEAGIMVKDGSGLERLAEIDTAMFDKTGTLTMGRPRLVDPAAIDGPALAIAAELAAHSRHPLSRAIAAHAPAGAAGRRFDAVRELPGLGLEARAGAEVWRLGRSAWAADGGEVGRPDDDATVLSRDGRVVARFPVRDEIRPGARDALSTLRREGIEIAILSGDGEDAVAAVARELGVEHQFGGLMPAGKVEELERLRAAGRSVLMVGDGLNDAPALAAAHVSMAPATAADIGRNAADFVFLRDSLAAVPFVLDIARRSGRLIRQNIALAIVYNAIAVPIAILGYVTPLIAAIAMSVSSLIVIGNALRLTGSRDAATESVAGHALLEPAE